MQGLLLVGILAGGNNSQTFDPNAQLNRTKAYMIFILAFMAITNIIVCPVLSFDGAVFSLDAF